MYTHTYVKVYILHKKFTIIFTRNVTLWVPVILLFCHKMNGTVVCTLPAVWASWVCCLQQFASVFSACFKYHIYCSGDPNFMIRFCSLEKVCNQNIWLHYSSTLIFPLFCSIWINISAFCDSLNLNLQLHPWSDVIIIPPFLSWL